MSSPGVTNPSKFNLSYYLSLLSWPQALRPRERPSPFRHLHPELLFIVLGFIRTIGDGIDSEPLSSREVKRCLSACSLTCRSWAEEFRPFIFERIAIRSDKDLRQLAAFLHSPISIVVHYIKYLEIKESSTSACTHTVPIVLYRQLPRLRTFSLKCVPAASVPFVLSQLWPTRSNFSYLPHFDRTMLVYRRGLQSVTTLTLQGYRLRDLGMLLRLIGGFPMLENLHCDGISWCEASFTSTPSRMILRSLPSATLRTVTARPPSSMRLDYLDFLWLFSRVEGHTRAEGRGLFHAEEIPTLINLARFVYWGKGDHFRTSSFARRDTQFVHFRANEGRRMSAFNISWSYTF